MKITTILKIYTLLLSIFVVSCVSKPIEEPTKHILTGAEQMDRYLPLLEGKKVGLVVNHTSVVGDTHLVDTLISRGLNIQKVFGPEHGFRGEAGAGEKVADESTDSFQIISLYGNHYKPTPEDLDGLDMVVFDIQDVGTRFYTYISTMHYVMEACAEQDIPFIVLDRPNPNGDYIDGPVRKEGFESFVGMHPIPVVHALTVGELAQMINGERWLSDSVRSNLTVIPVANYSHDLPWSLDIAPSPNLPNNTAIQWYPTLCFFEGTKMSIGRGTPFPFQVIGYPDSTFGTFSFTPVSIEGKAKYPKFENEVCYGLDLREVTPPSKIDLSYVIRFYSQFEDQEDFFTKYFNTLAGTDSLQNQLVEGWSEEEIRESWQPELSEYKVLRKKYLLYPDFE